MVKSQPMLSLRAMPGSVAMQQHGSVLISLTYIGHQRSCGHPWSSLPPGTILVSKNCAEMTSLLTGDGILEIWLYIRPGKHSRAGSGGAGKGEPALRVWESWPCHSFAAKWCGHGGNALPPHSLPSVEIEIEWENCPCPSLATALRRVVSAPHLVSTVDPALVAEMQVSQP